MKPSPLQSALINWCKSPSPPSPVAIGRGVAGCGKTTTLVACASALPSNLNAAAVAFNKHTAEQLAKRIRSTSVQSKTAHSFGLKLTAQNLSGGRPQVDGRKYYALAREWAQSRLNYPKWEGAGFGHYSEVASALVKLVDMARLTLSDGDGDALQASADAYSLERSPFLLAAALETLEKGRDQAFRGGLIDFTDMLWLPVKEGWLPPASERLDFLFADECQDFSPVQLRFLQSLIKPGGRSLWVGDPSQAIMGFAFADCHSYDKIKEEMNAVEFPLSICYRCPTSHLDLARQFVPEIQPRDSAPVGLVNSMSQDEISQDVKPGDLIVCRANAPLATLAIRMIGRGIQARVRGRDIGAQLVSLLEGPITATRPGIQASEIPVAIDDWASLKTNILIQRDAPDDQVDMVRAQAETLQACFEGFHPVSLAAFSNGIRDLFADEGGAVWLSSVHRAKGLEADRVRIIAPSRLGQPRKGSSADQAQQERNLKYVALTRGKETLTFEREESQSSTVRLSRPRLISDVENERLERGLPK